MTELSLIHDWQLVQSEVTSDGNLIAAFKRVGSSIRGRADIEVPLPALDEMQEAVTEYREKMRDLLFDRHPLVFWGAGSAGIGLVSTIGRVPEYWTDGNPNKFGKKFVGLDIEIVSPEFAFNEVKAASKNKPTLIITSSFASEIHPRVRQLGWQGDVFDFAGNRL